MKKKLRGRSGFSMLELMIVVGIIAILAAIAFVNVARHQRSLEQLERDSIAKEIFVAAQNHLTMAFGAGYYGIDETSYGTKGTYVNESTGEDDAAQGVYYILYDQGVKDESGNADEKAQNMYDLMLPEGSIDETVRSGGSYILRYQPELGYILDVFYCSTDSRFGASIGSFGITDLLEKYRGDDHKANRVHPETNTDSVLGWYGGTAAEKLASITLEAPKIQVQNGETLTVVVTDTPGNHVGLDDTADYALQLVVNGLSSEESQTLYVKLDSKAASSDASVPEFVSVSENGSSTEYTIVLDDITVQGRHFKKNFSSFYPGENIEVQAVAFSSSAISNTAGSAVLTTNSLFGDVKDTIPSGASAGDGVFDQALIGNFRHLENLDEAISGTDPEDTIWAGKLSLKNALQTTDLTFGETGSIFDSDTTIYDLDGNLAGNGYYPVNLTYALVYDGDGKSITGVEAVYATKKDQPISGFILTKPFKGLSGLRILQASATLSTVDVPYVNGGLFGSSDVEGIEVKNLQLINFTVRGSACAGVLAGKLTQATVTNVIAYNKGSAIPFNNKENNPNVAATAEAGIAGGLIGDAGSSTISDCAASVFVSGATAGGLVGNSSGTITESYSGGYTKDGSYEEDNFNVSGTLAAGGLVGTYSGSEISYSYSTCSAKADETGGTVGGFVGILSSGSKVTNCYSTGLVDGKTEYAFVGSGTVTGDEEEKSYYYSIINKDDTAIEDPYMSPENDTANEQVVSIDEDTDTFDQFLGGERQDANAYDETLISCYNGKFGMKTVEQLVGDTWPEAKEDYFVRTHYGDWPSPETFFLNDKSSDS